VNLLSYAVFTMFVGGVVLVVTVLFLNPKAALNRAMAVAGLFYAIWAFWMVFVFADDDPARVLGLYRLSYTGALFVVPAMFGVHLVLAGVPLRWRWACLVPAFFFSGFLYWQYLSGWFFYSSFRSGPWGNVGVPSGHQFWSSFSPLVYLGMEMVGFVLLWRARARTDSRRVRGQLTVAAVAIPVTYVLYAVAWILDVLLPVPPLEVLTGAWTLAVLLYLILKYRYLMRDDGLVEKYLASALQDAVLLLDQDRIVIGANPVAVERFSSPEASVIGQDFSVFVDDSPAFFQEWNRAQARRVLHGRMPHLVGGRCALLTISPLYDRSGDFLGGTILLGDLGDLDTNARDQKLTPREKQVLVLLMQGRNHTEIAEVLAVSPGTVKTHTHKIFEKTGATNRTQLFSRLLETPATPANVSPGR